MLMKKEDEINDTIKRKFINQIKSQLDYDGLMNLTQWFKDNAHHDYHHWGYVRSIAYRMERLGFATVIPEDDWMNKADPKFWIKHTKWQDRNPYLHQFIIGLMASIFSLTVALTVLIIKERGQNKIDMQQNSSITNLNDSLKNIQTEIDSLKVKMYRQKNK